MGRRTNTAVWLEKLGRKKLEALTDQDPSWIWPVPPASAKRPCKNFLPI